MSVVPEVTAHQLASELESGARPTLLDVREPDELTHSRLEAALNIPMDQVEERIAELDPEDDIVVICRSGGRSEKVARFLIGHGYAKVRNLVGGMNGWVADVDPSMNQY